MSLITSYLGNPGDPSVVAEHRPKVVKLREQELLGHADISLTLNVYSHVLPDMGDAAADAMDAALEYA